MAISSNYSLFSPFTLSKFLSVLWGFAPFWKPSVFKDLSVILIELNEMLLETLLYTMLSLCNGGLIPIIPPRKASGLSTILREPPYPILYCMEVLL